MAVGAVIASILTQYSDKGSKEAQKDIARLTKKFDDFGRKAKKSFGIAIAATATLAIKIGKDAVAAAIEDSKTQLVLANAMANSTGATEELIAAAEEYIKKTMFRVNVADDELRLSLTSLYIATGDLTEAQRIQSVALDVAAASGKDLSTVTLGITKAQQGNVGALKKLSPEISGLITKTTKFEDILAILGGTYFGTAEKLADLDPLTGLKLAYGEVLETLGYELLPVVREFAEYIKTDLLPIIEEWVMTNGDELRDGLKGILKLFITLGEVVIDVGRILNKFDGLIKFAVMVIGAGKVLKIFGRISAGIVSKTEGVSTQIKGLIDTFKSFSGSDSGLYKAVQLVGKLVENFGRFLLLIPGAQIAVSFFKGAWDALFGSSEKLGKSIEKTTKKTYNQMRADQIAADAAKKRADALKKAQAAAAAAAAKEAAKAAKEAALEEAINKRILSIRKQLNITKDSALDKETDIFQLAAAEALLKKQGVIAKEELAKIERIKEENFLLEARETLAKRYLDIQEKLADQKLDTKEIEELSKKWGISNESVVAYIHLVKSVEDQVISANEIKVLADMWNTSEAEAQKFLEVYMRIQDGLLSSNEVFDLIQKGFFQSEKEARIYADLVATVHDGIANDEDFEKLRIKWDLSKTQVNAYLAAMGAKFDYQGTFIDPVTLLKTQWELATKALEAYLAMLNSGKGIDYNKFGPGSVSDDAANAAAKAAADAAAAAAAEAEALAKEAEAAAAAIEAAARASAARDYAIAKASGDMDAAALAAAKVNPSALAAQESGAIGAASISAALKAAEQALQNERIMSTYASFRAKEAEDAAKAAANAASTISSPNYDERFRFMNSTVNTAQGISGGNLMAAPVVNITVQGSVTAEQDLVTTVRNGLLAAQYNGNSITLQAI